MPVPALNDLDITGDGAAAIAQIVFMGDGAFPDIGDEFPCPGGRGAESPIAVRWYRRSRHAGGRRPCGWGSMYSAKLK